jgi:hypothetical protein
MTSEAISGPSVRPDLTIIMPAHCGERWIDATLRSVAAEATDRLELIVLDSSPNPATLDIAQGYADRIRLQLLKRPDLLSWQAKTKFAVSIASSEHICWLHQDDIWMPGRAEAVFRWIDAAPDAALHLAPTAIIDAQDRRLGLWRCPLPDGRPLPKEMLLSRLLVQNFISTPAPVFTKAAWDACGGIDNTLWYTADWDLWLKLASVGPVIYHDEVTTGFRVHGDSQTVVGSRNIDDFTCQLETVLNRHLSSFGGCPRTVERAARASIRMNVALAAAAAGQAGRMIGAGAAVLALGPRGIAAYLRDSRLIERIAPRLKAQLRGAF